VRTRTVLYPVPSETKEPVLQPLATIRSKHIRTSSAVLVKSVTTKTTMSVPRPALSLADHKIEDFCNGGIASGIYPQDIHSPRRSLRQQLLHQQAIKPGASCPRVLICDGISTLYKERYTRSAFLYRYIIPCPGTDNEALLTWRNKRGIVVPVIIVRQRPPKRGMWCAQRLIHRRFAGSIAASLASSRAKR
jgi:hypothetical protein